jgi:hypothetical protein
MNATQTEDKRCDAAADSSAIAGAIEDQGTCSVDRIMPRSTQITPEKCSTDHENDDRS